MNKLFIFLLSIAITFILTACEDLGGPTGVNNPQGIGWTGRFLYEYDINWKSNRNLNLNQFEQKKSTWSNQGYLMIDIDVRHDIEVNDYSAVWQENIDDREWNEHHDLSSNEYNNLWDQYKEQGYRPLDVEAYRSAGSNGDLQFAGIWIENKEGLDWWSQRNMTSSEYADHFDRLSEDGYRPIDIEAYPTNNGIRYAAIWYDNVDDLPWSQLRNIDRDRYQQEADAHGNNGYMMIDYESYDAGNSQNYAAIWELQSNRPAYQIRTNRTAIGFGNLWRSYSDMGMRLMDFEEHNVDGQTASLNGGIWIRNSPRFQYQNKGAINTAVENYLQNNPSIPALSVAVIEDGEIVYKRGFGESNPSIGLEAYSETIYGMASVSKLFGGTLAALLEENGTFDMTNPTSDYLTNIPDDHDHTVEQLTAHLACVPHYPGSTTPGISNQTIHYDSQLNAAQSFWKTHPVNGCTTGNNRSYSTHAFTILGAVIEEVMNGTELEDILRDELTDPFGLSNTRVMYESSNLPYEYFRAEANYNDSSWKILGGGLESTVVDMARFGWLILDGQIVNANTRDNRLLAPVDDTCNAPGNGTCRNGIAWELRTHGVRDIAEHGGSWSGMGTRLRLYTDDDLVIAVASNQRGSSQNLSALVSNIANAIL